MANGFVVNAHRFDPYKNFKFRVLWDNKVVAAVSKVGALKRTTEVVTHRSGGENSIDHKSPGRTSYDDVSLERGLTHDMEFHDWASKVHTYEGDGLMALADYKKEVTIEMMNMKGQVAFRYFLHAVWVKDYTALPDLDANANGVAFESLTLVTEGWERDMATTEPDESA